MSARPTIKFMAPLKGEDSPQRGEMSAQPTDYCAKLLTLKKRDAAFELCCIPFFSIVQPIRRPLLMICDGRS